MVREFRVAITKTTDVDDLLDARGLCGTGSVACGLAVELGKVSPGAHRVDEPVDDVEALEGAIERGAIECIALDNFDPLNELEVGIGSPCDRPHLCTFIAQRGNQTTADVPRRSDDAHLEPVEPPRCVERRRGNRDRVDHAGNRLQASLGHPAVHEVLPKRVRRSDEKGFDAQALEPRTVAIDDHAQVDTVAFDASNHT